MGTRRSIIDGPVNVIDFDQPACYFARQGVSSGAVTVTAHLVTHRAAAIWGAMTVSNEMRCSVHRWPVREGAVLVLRSSIDRRAGDATNATEEACCTGFCANPLQLATRGGLLALDQGTLVGRQAKQMKKLFVLTAGA